MKKKQCSVGRQILLMITLDWLTSGSMALRHLFYWILCHLYLLSDTLPTSLANKRRSFYLVEHLCLSSPGSRKQRTRVTRVVKNGLHQFSQGAVLKIIKIRSKKETNEDGFCRLDAQHSWSCIQWIRSLTTRNVFIKLL